MGLERKIKRNEIRTQYGNKGIRNEFKLFQIHKYGLAEYAKMNGKTVDEVLKEEA